MGVGEAFLLAVSLCADCFACTLCAGVTLSSGPGRNNGRKVAGIALLFGVIHTSFLMAGWGLGTTVVGFVERISHWIGFLLLLYVGGGMLLEGIRSLRGKCDFEYRRLDGLQNVLLSAVATSIDALGVGVSQTMVEGGRSAASILPLASILFGMTLLVVWAGLSGGRMIGREYGHWAEVLGGLILIGIGVSFLL